MASLIALIVIFCFIYVFVTAGAVAYELTGMDRTSARFQALSAFTGTGFTTTESRKALATPLRRRITTWLIVTGWVSGVSVVAALIEAVDVATVTHAARNFGIGVGFLVVAWYVFRWRGYDLMLMDVLRRYLVPRLTQVEVPQEALFQYQRGFGIARIEVPPDSTCIGRTLRELHLPEHQLQILLIEHEDQTVAVPGADERLHEGAHLVVFGRLSRIERVFRSGP